MKYCRATLSVVHPSFVQPLCSFYSTNPVVLRNLQLLLLLFCQRHCLQTTQACCCCCCSVNATVSRPHRHVAVVVVLSTPLSPDHTGMLLLLLFCQRHCLQTTQACCCCCCSVNATVSRPHRHVAVVVVLSTPLSPDHTGMLLLLLFCQRHCLQTTQACCCCCCSVNATVSRPHRHAGVVVLSTPLSPDHTGMPVLLFCQRHCLQTTQACPCSTRTKDFPF